MKKMAVVGAGTMGNGIAHVFAQGGWDVTLIDVAQPQLDNALAVIKKNMDRQVKKELLTEADRDAALGRIATETELDKAAGAELVVEAATEAADLKFQLFEKLNEITAADTILASNTSSISITEIAGHTDRPDKVIGMHFMNPVPMMKLVEIIRGLGTSDETTAKVTEISSSLSKTPVEVNDYPGFVANRILMPMINEAVYCVMEGVATPESVDTVMKLGMAHPMGPLALADLIGLDVCLAILEVLHSGLGDSKYRPCPLLRNMVAAGRLGRKTGQGFYEYN
ncbi:MAG: 3-hydroxybutyryl-CoA dehydrogenase [Gemmatimonadota bacterium]|nr:MAG: 3-hydroxybutyryl-CoA dehydrogenase [Gemmatimonadota bacterium]